MRKITLLLLVVLCSGCAESYFRLAEDSRLPRWLEVPEGKTREQYSVQLTYYVWPSGREAILKLKEKDGWFYGKKITAKLDGERPNYLPESIDRKPSYEIARENGVVDIIEHRAKNDVFYMNDDPEVWKALGVTPR